MHDCDEPLPSTRTSREGKSKSLATAGEANCADKDRSRVQLLDCGFCFHSQSLSSETLGD